MRTENMARQKVFCAKFIASGKVQGVGFRDFVCRVGKSIGLSGFAKNLPDGTVEIAAQGTEDKIELLAQRISVRAQHGISVERLVKLQQKETDSPLLSSFSVRF